MARDYLMFFRNRTSPAASSRAASDGAALWCCLRLGGLFLFLSRVGRPELAARIQEQAVGLYKPVGIFHGVAPCQLLDLHCGNQRDRVGVLACTPCLDGYLPVVDARGLAAVVEPEARGRVLACGRRGKPRAAQGGRVLQVLGEGIGLAGPCGLPAVAARGRCEGNGSRDGDECILHFFLFCWRLFLFLPAKLTTIFHTCNMWAQHWSPGSCRVTTGGTAARREACPP